MIVWTDLDCCHGVRVPLGEVLQRPVVAVQLPLIAAARPALPASGLQVVQLDLLVLHGPLLLLLLLYELALLVQLVLAHVGRRNVVHPGEK